MVQWGVREDACVAELGLVLLQQREDRLDVGPYRVTATWRLEKEREREI